MSEIVDVSRFVGMELEEATKLAEQKGLLTRVTARDGETFMVTADLRTDRVNFTVVKDQVMTADIG